MSNKHYENYLKTVGRAIDALITNLEPFYPGIGDKTYETGDSISSFADRMIFGIYLELIKAGYFNENNSSD